MLIFCPPEALAAGERPRRVLPRVAWAIPPGFVKRRQSCCRRERPCWERFATRPWRSRGPLRRMFDCSLSLRPASPA